MKIAKKVLSVILSIAMILSTFAVAASAMGTPASEYTAKWKLTAESGKFNWTSNTKYTGFIGDGNEAQELTVEKGSMVNVKVYLSTNYYIGATQAYYAYSKELGDGKDVYLAARPSGSYTVGRTDKMAVFNDAHPFMAEEMANATQLHTMWSDWVAEGKATGLNSHKDLTTGDYFFGREATASNATEFPYKLGLLWTQPDAANGVTMRFQESDYEGAETEALFSFPIYVPEDIADGTYYVKIFAEGAKCAANPKGQTYVANNGDEEVTAASLKAANDALTKNDDIYYDCTEAVVTLKVGNQEAPSIDYSALEALVAEVEGLNSSIYTVASWAGIAAPLAAAKAIVDAQNADSQATVDDAKDALLKAKNALKVLADYSALDAAIASAEAVDLSKYEQDSNWDRFVSKLTIAKNVARDLEATTANQAIIDNAKNALADAQAALVEKVELKDANYGDLDAELALSNAITDSSLYDSSLWAAFVSARTAAANVDRNLKEDSQSVIDNLKNALTNARLAMVNAPADYTRLNAAIANAQGLDRSIYTADSLAAVDSALTNALAVAPNMTAANQATINAAADALEAALASLKKLGGADYSALDAEIKAGTQYAESFYTVDSWSAYATELANAEAMLVAGNLLSNQQSIVDNEVTALRAAKSALDLKGADYTAVDNALALVPSDADLNNYYSADAVAAVKAAVAAVKRGKDITEQSVVAGYADAINAAVAALENNLIPANTSALEALVADADALSDEIYTAESLAAIAAPLANAKALLANSLSKRDNQAEVDAAYNALKAAYDARQTKGANYADLDKAINDYESKSADDYTADSWANAANAYNAAKAVARDLDLNGQGTIDAAAAALNAALAALVEADADFAALNSAVSKAPSAALRKMLDETYLAELDALFDKAASDEIRGLKKSEQSVVDALVAEINAKIANKVYKAYDYSVVDGYVAEFNGLNEADYTAESWAAAKAVFDNIDRSFTVMDAAKGKALEASLKAALEGLVPAEGDANYDALNNAISVAEGILGAADIADYTDDSVAALQSALDAAKKVPAGLKESQQNVIDEAVKAINDAKNLTLKGADYSELNAAIASAPSDSTKYTTESWANLLSAVNAANDVKKAGYTIKDQKVVDDAKDAVLAAIAALELKPVVTNGTVVSVDYDRAVSTTNTFTIKVNGRASKLQFVYPDGTTATYDRRHASLMGGAPVSYDADGNVVDGRDVNIAYEIWTLTTITQVGVDIAVRAKYNYNWEAMNLSKYFKVILTSGVGDADVSYGGITCATEGASGKVAASVQTGLGVDGVRFILADGSTVTFKTATISGTSKTYDCFFIANSKGENNIKLQIKANNVWTDAESIVYTVV